ncbi:MAG TPA: hypothetical protein VKZ95_00150 [Sphingobacteriaceae bacterium]|nr:hypothetical protein [Sphingobacteriaceae bacterium]
MREELHKLLDMVLDASEQGIDLSLDIRPLVCIGIYDSKTWSYDINGNSTNTGIYEKEFQVDGIIQLDRMIEKTEKYIKNHG